MSKRGNCLNTYLPPDLWELVAVISSYGKEKIDGPRGELIVDHIVMKVRIQE